MESDIPASAPAAEAPPEKKESWWETLRFYLILFVAALALRTFMRQHALESARPWLFVDALGITAQRYFAVPGAAQPQEGGLDVGFNLYGYLRPAAGARP